MAAKWPEFQYLSRKEIIAFLRLCADTRRRGREEALGLLLSPEGAELPGYYARLFEHLARSEVRTGVFPRELLQVFIELIAFAGKTPRDPKLRGLFHRSVANMPRSLLTWLFEKRYRIVPFLDCIADHLAGSRHGSAESRNRWRILRNLLARRTMLPVSGSVELTLADLGPLVATGAKLPRAAWRMKAKHLLMWGGLSSLPPPSGLIEIPAAARTAGAATEAASRPSSHEVPIKRRAGKPVLHRAAADVVPARPLSFSKMYWGGLGNRALAFWDRLADAQARELIEIRRLARQVSADTGRVVLSWHNASVAAAGGWGFEDISRLFASPVLYRDFACSVRQSAEEIRRDLDERVLSGLFEMRAKRIFAPKAAHALERIRALREIGCVSKSDWRDMTRRAGVLLDPFEIEQIDSGRKTEWSGEIAPHQQVDLDRVLSWYDHSKKTWTQGLCLLFALAIRGREAIESGMVSHFVLPWIDKFFISSRRHADQGYVEELFGQVAGRIEAPLILFWEDTAHARLPSFGLCLEQMAARGLPFRGIGIFDPHGSARSDAKAIILREYPKSLLFALRPFSDAHFSGTARPVFDRFSPGSLLDYDSSWKDNLVFIYTGTQVFPLLSVQTEMESISSWISDGRRRYPFGAWFRKLLRAGIHGEENDPIDPSAFTYASWANLL